MTNQEMTITEHLTELKTRILWSLTTIGIFFLFAMFFSDKIWEIISLPLKNSSSVSLINIAPTEALMIELKISFFVALIFASPFCLWQIWIFIKPAFSIKTYSKFLNQPILFIFGATILSALGSFFAFSAVLPLSLEFLMLYSPVGISQNWTQEIYYSFIINMILSFALIFQFPLVSYLLAKFNLINYKFWIKHFRPALIIVLICSALITPPDALSMLIISIPMLLLYAISILIAFLVSYKFKIKDHYTKENKEIQVRND